MRLINFAHPKTAPKAVRKGSKTETIIKLGMREEGVTLSALSKALSKTGAAVSPQYARAWVAKSYLHSKGYGIKSELTKDGKDLRIHVTSSGLATDNSRSDVEIKPKKTAVKKKTKKVAAPTTTPAEEQAA